MRNSMAEERSFPDLVVAELELPVADPIIEADLDEAFEKGWEVIVWNDPINLMSYVVYVLQKVLNFDKAQATRHMLEVHHQGKSCVTRETREKAEHIQQLLQQRGLKVSLQKSS